MTALLRTHGIEVLGLTSNITKARIEFQAGPSNGLELQTFDYFRAGAFAHIVQDYKPDLIFNFAAKATGQGMFDTPYEMNRLNGAFVLDILEGIRASERKDAISFCQASSSEMFGAVQQKPQNENTCFRPKSPYGAAKLYAHNMVNIYRAVYGLRCCSAILYNHESVRRSPQFVTKKIAMTAAMIKLGLKDQLEIGHLGTSRDWGYSPEYMDALFLMATALQPKDYIVATGRLNTIGKLCEIAFGHLCLNYKEFVRPSADKQRLDESVDLCGDPSKIHAELGWTAKRTIEQIMVEMVEAELVRLKNEQ